MEQSVRSGAKRALDVTVAALALLVASPIMLVAAVAIWLTMGRPIFFVQRRPGLDGTPFDLMKFRTMTQALGSPGSRLPDEQRVTKLGRFLRTTTIDELPELLNVLHGDMSLVGPRPLLMEYLDRYTPEQARRHEVKPGLTGWAVISGRNSLTWDEKLKLDVWYVDNRSFWLDIKILFKTVGLVFARRGVSAEGHATMPEFMGTEEVKK